MSPEQLADDAEHSESNGQLVQAVCMERLRVCCPSVCTEIVNVNQRLSFEFIFLRVCTP